MMTSHVEMEIEEQQPEGEQEIDWLNKIFKNFFDNMDFSPQQLLATMKCIIELTSREFQALLREDHI